MKRPLYSKMRLLMTNWVENLMRGEMMTKYFMKARLKSHRLKKTKTRPRRKSPKRTKPKKIRAKRIKIAKSLIRKRLKSPSLKNLKRRKNKLVAINPGTMICVEPGISPAER